MPFIDIPFQQSVHVPNFYLNMQKAVNLFCNLLKDITNNIATISQYVVKLCFTPVCIDAWPWPRPLSAVPRCPVGPAAPEHGQQW